MLSSALSFSSPFPLHASEKKGYADNVKLGVCAAHCFYYHMTAGDDALAHKVLQVLGPVERLFANSSSAISGSRDDLNRMQRPSNTYGYNFSRLLQIQINDKRRIGKGFERMASAQSKPAGRRGTDRRI